MKTHLIVIIAVFVLSDQWIVAEDDVATEKATLQLTSESFTDGGTIPVEHTCKGSDRSPSLSWERGPEATRSYCLIVTDPDAPIPFITVVHWVLFNIPPECTELPEAIAAGELERRGIMQGKRFSGKHDYLGPCPPFGSHRYIFRIFALDTTLTENPKKVSLKRVTKVLKGHMVASGKLVGHFPGK